MRKRYVRVGEEGYRIPDHSALLWDILVDGGPVLFPLPTKVHEVRPLKKFVAPEDYMHDQEDFIADIVVRLKGFKDEQDDLGSIYCELLEELKSGLKEVNCDGKRQVLVWFTKEPEELRKKMHRKEKGWLEGKATAEAKSLRNEYLTARAGYTPRQ